jgi:hypothetical protein
LRTIWLTDQNKNDILIGQLCSKPITKIFGNFALPLGKLL